MLRKPRPTHLNGQNYGAHHFGNQRTMPNSFRIIHSAVIADKLTTLVCTVDQECQSDTDWCSVGGRLLLTRIRHLSWRSKTACQLIWQYMARSMYRDLQIGFKAFRRRIGRNRKASAAEIQAKTIFSQRIFRTKMKQVDSGYLSTTPSERHVGQTENSNSRLTSFLESRMMGTNAKLFSWEKPQRQSPLENTVSSLFNRDSPYSRRIEERLSIFT